MMQFPTLYVSHGAPTLALAPGRVGPMLTALGNAMPKPAAVVVISAHWETSGLEVLSHPAPVTIHDFGGFPDALYALHYRAPGSPEIAARVVDVLAEAGLPARQHPTRGLDHGAWVPLMHLYPDADVPVLQLSLPCTATPEVLWTIGNALAPLRDEGVLFVASGGITHNLYEFRMGVTEEEAYARNFMEWFAKAIVNHDREGLLAYRRQAPAASRAHPTDEHLRPVFMALGAAGEQWADAVRFEGGIDFGVIGMDAYAFGVPSALRGLLDPIATTSKQHGEQA